MTLSQQGHQTVLTSAKPHLVGLEVDPLSTDIVIYHLEVGAVHSYCKILCFVCDSFDFTTTKVFLYFPCNTIFLILK